MYCLISIGIVCWGHCPAVRPYSVITVLFVIQRESAVKKSPVRARR